MLKEIVTFVSLLVLPLQGYCIYVSSEKKQEFTNKAIEESKVNNRELHQVFDFLRTSLTNIGYKEHAKKLPQITESVFENDDGLVIGYNQNKVAFVFGFFDEDTNKSFGVRLEGRVDSLPYKGDVPKSLNTYLNRLYFELPKTVKLTTDKKILRRENGRMSGDLVLEIIREQRESPLLHSISSYLDSLLTRGFDLEEFYTSESKYHEKEIIQESSTYWDIKFKERVQTRVFYLDSKDKYGTTYWIDVSFYLEYALDYRTDRIKWIKIKGFEFRSNTGRGMGLSSTAGN